VLNSKSVAAPKLATAKVLLLAGTAGSEPVTVAVRVYGVARITGLLGSVRSSKYPPAKVHDDGRVATPLTGDTVTLEVDEVPGHVRTPPDTVMVTVPVQLVKTEPEELTTATAGAEAKGLPETPPEGCAPPPWEKERKYVAGVTVKMLLVLLKPAGVVAVRVNVPVVLFEVVTVQPLYVTKPRLGVPGEPAQPERVAPALPETVFRVKVTGDRSFESGPPPNIISTTGSEVLPNGIPLTPPPGC
jgi:hypothetical protein